MSITVLTLKYPQHKQFWNAFIFNLWVLLDLYLLYNLLEIQIHA